MGFEKYLKSTDGGGLRAELYCLSFRMCCHFVGTSYLHDCV